MCDVVDLGRSDHGGWFFTQIMRRAFDGFTLVITIKPASAHFRTVLASTSYISA